MKGHVTFRQTLSLFFGKVHSLLSSSLKILCCFKKKILVIGIFWKISVWKDIKTVKLFPFFKLKLALL